MMFPSNRVRALVSTQPVDFRNGHDGLAAIVSSDLRKDPFTGTVSEFRSRWADRLKLLYWDCSGLVSLGDAGSACRATDGLQATGGGNLWTCRGLMPLL